jgi:hypothetical protein
MRILGHIASTSVAGPRYFGTDLDPTSAPDPAIFCQ